MPQPTRRPRRRPESAADGRWRVAVGVPAGFLAVSALLIVARWPAYWQWVAPEQTPMTFELALLRQSAGLAAALLALRAAIGGAPRNHRSLWLTLVAGFGAVMLDERFALHERIRDGYIGGFGVALQQDAQGDYLLVLYAVAGALLVPRVLRLLSDDGPARGLFVAGVVLAAVAVAAGSFDITRWSVAVQHAVHRRRRSPRGWRTHCSSPRC